MKIYVRKMFPHDITHEVSVTKEIVNDFFDGRVSLSFEGVRSHEKGIVTINDATDPRFGGAFKSLIEKEGGADVDDLLIISKSTTYKMEVVRISDYRYKAFFSLYSNQDRHVIFSVEDDMANTENKQKSSIKTAENIILYGVPGCGKSHKIKTEYCDNEQFMERVVFHPDYTYSDFVGQILPENDNGHISYPFIPGPFTRVLAKAESDPAKNYYLVIEELNRGNAPAIFGEVFQLLDRVDGVSEYGINNADIALEVYGDANHQVKLPRNLFILATMNTADQNVFTLDTAFKRRWKMISIANDIDGCIFAANPICGSDISWKSFLRTINNKIIELGEGNIGNEDKRLGAFFVKPNELSDIDLFSEKVLMYLWNDAFRYEHDKVFKAQYKTLEQLIDGFKTNLFDVFVPGIQFERINVGSIMVTID